MIFVCIKHVDNSSSKCEWKKSTSFFDTRRDHSVHLTIHSQIGMKKNVIRVAWYCVKNRRKKGLKKKSKKRRSFVFQNMKYTTQKLLSHGFTKAKFFMPLVRELNLELIDSMQKIHELCHLGNDNKRTRESDGDMYMLEAFVHVSIIYTLVSTRQ